MNRNTLWGTFAVVLLIILGALVSQQEASSISSLRQKASAPKLIANKPEAKLNQLVKSNNSFGFDLFSRLRQNQQSQPQNIFISPQSIAIALAMTRKGTEGETQLQMSKTLGLAQFDSKTVDSSYRKLIETWKTVDPDLDLAIANSLWVNQNLSLKDDFINTTQNFYQGTVSNLDFADTSASNTINQWVASNTMHKIPQIIDGTSPENALYLINAIYFKGSWTDKFDPSATNQQPFYLGAKRTKTIGMMNQTGEYRYYENEKFQGIRLPYGRQGELGMYIFLPKENSSLEQFYQQLNLANWQDWLSQMRSQPGKISLPKFKLEYATDLKEALSALGMEKVFNADQADFSAMTDSRVAINQIKHKALIEVNEEGTEAAGATSIGIRITSAMPQEQAFEMNINRPFFFAICDDITETMLFMGNIVEPK